MSQTKEILEFMQKGRSITPQLALDKFGCFRLSARIAEIEAMGYEVVHALEQTRDGKRFGVYWLKTDGRKDSEE